MRRLVLCCLFLTYFASSSATHIVGGEFELEHIKNHTYQLRLILYFDDVYGDPLAEDPNAVASVFSKKNDEYIQSFILENRQSAYVEYSNPECVYDSLITRRILYSLDIELPPDIYNDPEGYYVVWERCCRNNVIDNIIEPEKAGQVFYLEFPPVIKNGQPFINSSPVLFPPLSDYACVGQDYYVDFRGKDKDGDSLAYSLVTPMSGHTNQDEPVTPFPMSRPYAPVQWRDGINVNNMTPGVRPLQISKAGILAVNPSFEGLYVFGIKCEEFRNGEKIGEVRRDFQMLVIACEDPGSRPSAMIKLPDEDDFYNEIDTIKVTGAGDACFTVYVTDPDPEEKISFRAFSVNFTDRLDGLFSSYSGVTSHQDDTLKIELCLPQCPVADMEIAVFDLIVMDDACSQPLTDSIRLVVDYSEVLNSPPYFTFAEDTLNYALAYNDALELVLEGRDDNLSNLSMQPIRTNFDLQEYNMTFRPAGENEPGKIAYNFSFDADCSKYDFTTQSEFQAAFLLLDEDACGFPASDTLVVNITVDMPENNNPVVIKDYDADDAVVRLNEGIRFPVSATDADHDLVTLFAVGEDFDLEDYGLSFQNTNGFGTAVSEFSWTPDCSLKLPEKDNFTVLFIAEDHDACLSSSADTTRLQIQVRPPENNPPNVMINVFADSLPLRVGQTLDFRVTAYDIDGDSIFLELVDNPALAESLSVSFEPQEGISSVAGVFSYTPTCEHLNEDLSPRDLMFKFFATDNKCYNARADTATIKVTVVDVPGGYSKFNPPNVFSPNGDEYNPTFTLPDLPANNCYGQFHEIRIFNRWGSLVYQSNDREFAWDGGGNDSGVYYYVIRYTTFRYKGSVSILR